jgi:hypothetical protein
MLICIKVFRTEYVIVSISTLRLRILVWNGLSQWDQELSTELRTAAMLLFYILKGKVAPVLN